MRRSFKLLIAPLAVAGLLCNDKLSYAQHAVDGGMVVSGDVIFDSGYVIDAGDIHVTNSVNIINHADLYGDIYIADVRDVSIRNTGNIDGTIYLGQGATLSQVIHGPDDVTFLNVDGDYTVFVDNARGLHWDELNSIANGALELVINDSEIVFQDLLDARLMRSVYREPVPVVLRGTVVINLPDDYIPDVRPLIGNVTGMGDVVVAGGNAGPLHAFDVKFVDDNLFLSVVRETDYYKILGNDTGAMLNFVRDVRPDDALLRKLDCAQTVDDISSILKRSAAFHPIRLGRPMHVLNNFISSGALQRSDSSNSVAKIDAAPFYVFGHDVDLYGGAIGIGVMPVDELAFDLNVYGAIADAHDIGNDFVANMYGGNVSVSYQKNALYLHAMAGATYSDIDVPYVFDAGRLKTDANGMSAYGIADFGIRFDYNDYFWMLPYVGGGYEYEKILSHSNSVTYARGGMKLGVSFDGLDLRYDYIANFSAKSDGGITGGLGIGFWSYADFAGMDASFHFFEDNLGTSYMASISASVAF